MRGTPGPVPNPEAKPHRAESTAGSARGRPGRRRPVDGTGPFGPEGAAGVSPAAPFFVLARDVAFQFLIPRKVILSASV